VKLRIERLPHVERTGKKAIAVRWLKAFWGHSWTPEIVDDLAAYDILTAAEERRRISYSASARYSKTSNFAARPIS
jgi:hypothetical protein